MKPTAAAAWLAVAAATAAADAPPAAVDTPRTIAGDGMPTALAAQPGDPMRGRAIVVSRQQGMCLLCHSGPFPEERVPGTVSTSLAGAGSRWSMAQLRLRVVDARALNPASVMPPFHRIDAASEAERRVAAAWRGKHILDAQQIEDVVAFLATLREP